MENYNPREIKGKNLRDIKYLHPIVKNIAEEFLTTSNEYLKMFEDLKNIEIKIISTLRTFEEQDELYQKGRTTPGRIVTKAKAGQSIHNWGCAFDLGCFENKIYLDNENPKKSIQIYNLIKPIADKLKLTWGGDFISFKDYPHYQYTGKFTNSQFLKLVNGGENITDLLEEK